MDTTTTLRIVQLTLGVTVMLAGVALLVSARLQPVLAGSAVAATTAAGAALTRSGVRGLRQTRRVRKAWGMRKQKTAHADLATVARIRHTVAGHCGARAVDNQTVVDVDIAAVHGAANHCISLVGEEFLYVLLSMTPESPQDVERRRMVMQWFREGSSEARNAAATLLTLGRDRQRSVAELLWIELPPVDRSLSLYLVEAGLTITLAVMLFSGLSWALVPLVVAIVANTFVYTRVSYTFMHHLPRLTQLVSVLAVAEKLAEAGALRALAPLSIKTDRRAIRRVGRLARFISRQHTHPNDPLTLLLLYLKVFLLMDALVFPWLRSRLSRHIDILRDAYVYVGCVDALQALDSFRGSYETTCWARPAADARVQARGLYHPLVCDPVGNDLDLRPPGVLLTGSNMAGKSTLLRCIVLNALFAQTVGFAFAEEFVCSPVHLWTLIHKADSVSRGASFYQYEAARVKEILTRTANEAGHHVIAVDEFFSGTNSTERIAAATAVLDHLADQGFITVAATHDQEIAEALAPRYTLMYFDSEVSHEGLAFDYRLKPGIARSTNGIALLEALDYPASIVAAARERSGNGESL